MLSNFSGFQPVLRLPQPVPVIRFEGATRQRTFLNTFNRMEPQCQDALKDIYNYANGGADHEGRHVVLAMTAAARFPEIFRLVLMNIVVRLMLKHHEKNGNEAKAERFRETLEDFHVALDSFMDPKVTLEEAARRRLEGEEPSRPVASVTPLPLVSENEELRAQVFRFKEEARPTVERVKANNKKRARRDP